MDEDETRCVLNILAKKRMLSNNTIFKKNSETKGFYLFLFIVETVES